MKLIAERGLLPNTEFFISDSKEPSILQNLSEIMLLNKNLELCTFQDTPSQHWSDRINII